MWCKVKRGDREGLVEIKDEIRRYRTFRIRIVYRWMGYLREEQVQLYRRDRQSRQSRQKVSY